MQTAVIQVGELNWQQFLYLKPPHVFALTGDRLICFSGMLH